MVIGSGCNTLSIDRPRPLIIRSEAKPSACRLRFDLAHECGHLVMHRGIETGDKETEDQANRFASAFLLPRTSFIHEFPRGPYLNWQAIFDMKLRWKVSAAAILRRAFDLKMLSAGQYRTGHIHLSKTGQRKVEKFDDVIVTEMPELLPTAMSALEDAFPGAIRRIAAEAGLEDDMFLNVAGISLPHSLKSTSDNVVNFPSWTAGGS